MVFWPGVLTYDATFVYNAIHDEQPGDWQSPVMTWLWGLIDPIAPGPGSMFLLIVSLYWLGFGTLALAIFRKAPILAMALPLLALTPPAFILAGVIWRDILLADVWLLAAALAYASANQRKGIRVPVRILALILVFFGLMLRQNSLFAAPILAAYVIWPASFAWRKILLSFIPLIALMYGASQFVFYDLLNAARQNLLHTIFVFDIGGITHFTQENWFPVAFTENEWRLVKGACYDPTQWDTYWRLDPCSFVMDKLEDQKIFGYPAMIDAWKKAILANPLAYLEHRFAHFSAFLVEPSSTFALHALEDPERPMFTDHALLDGLGRIDAAVNQTVFFRLIFWVLAALAVFAAAWRARANREGAYALAVTGSAIVYMATYLPVGVASAYRYGYWAVLASMTGAVLTLIARRGGREGARRT